MSREIKFRFWDGQEMEMPCKSLGLYRFEEIGITHVVDGIGQSSFGKSINVMQYTGLKDSNSNEVFDSDVIRNVDTRDLQVVFWNQKEAAWYCRYVEDKNRIVSLADSIGNLNVKIGNIYENPELL